MEEELKSQAKEIINVGIVKIVNNYTDNALLINSCFVSSSRYKTIAKTTGLSTIQGIPKQLRLDNEIDVQFTNEDLVQKYNGDVQNVIFKNYIVMSISIVDAVLEDAYELFIKEFEDTISDSDLEKRIRSSWANNNLINYFLSDTKANLKKPLEMKTEINEAFMRYKELRIIRHSLVHSEGLISDKNIETLKSFKELTPEERKGMALIDSSIINEDNKIILSINIILSIRQYLDRFLMYIYKSISNA